MDRDDCSLRAIMVERKQPKTEKRRFGNFPRSCRKSESPTPDSRFQILNKVYLTLVQRSNKKPDILRLKRLNSV